MFTGIIESLGLVEDVLQNGTNRSFRISSPISHELNVDQSLSHNGICLTIESITGASHQVTAIAETLAKTNAKQWEKGDIINLERAMNLNTRLDGHLVQGHVDTVATCIDITDKEGSREMKFSFPGQFSALVIEKGSICLNGISLTAFGVTEKQFSVAIIPYTWENTNLKNIKPGMLVNIEFDMIGKYIQRHIMLNQQNLS